MRYGYLVVEGADDIEFLGRLLKPFDIKRVKHMSQLDLIWRPLVPEKFPHNDDLTHPVPIPTFFQNADVSIAIHSAVGEKKLISTLQESLEFLPVAELYGIGLLMDADLRHLPGTRFADVCREMATYGLALIAPNAPGMIQAGNPRFGVYVLPDNVTQGTLETILMECAKTNYPEFLARAQNYLASVESADIIPTELREFRKPAGLQKATLSAMSSVLKPGRTFRVSLQDNRWINSKTLLLPRVQRVQQFLVELLGIR